MGDLLMKTISEGFFLNQHLQSLNLSKNELSVQGIFSLQLSLRTTQVTELNLSHNNLGENGVRALTQYLTDKTCVLRTLNISSCKIKPQGALYLFERISQKGRNMSLKNLNISNNRFKTYNMERLGHAIDHGALEKLDISECELGPIGMVQIAKNLAKSQTLLELIAPENCCGDECLKFFSESLANPQCCLESLNLSANNLSDKAGTHFSRALLTNQCLRRLNLSQNSLTSASGERLVQMLQVNHKIVSLCLENNHSFSFYYVEKICQIIKRNQAFQSKSKIPKLDREKKAEEKKFEGMPTHDDVLGEIEKLIVLKNDWEHECMLIRQENEEEELEEKKET